MPVASLDNQLKSLYSTFQHYHTHTSPPHCGSAVTNGYLLSEVELHGSKVTKVTHTTCRDHLKVYGIALCRIATVAVCVARECYLLMLSAVCKEMSVRYVGAVLCLTGLFMYVHNYVVK